jgi:hypothetical protein
MADWAPKIRNRQGYVANTSALAPAAISSLSRLDAPNFACTLRPEDFSKPWATSVSARRRLPAACRRTASDATAGVVSKSMTAAITNNGRFIATIDGSFSSMQISPSRHRHCQFFRFRDVTVFAWTLSRNSRTLLTAPVLAAIRRASSATGSRRWCRHHGSLTRLSRTLFEQSGSKRAAR